MSRPLVRLAWFTAASKGGTFLVRISQFSGVIFHWGISKGVVVRVRVRLGDIQGVVVRVRVRLGDIQGVVKKTLSAPWGKYYH